MTDKTNAEIAKDILEAHIKITEDAMRGIWFSGKQYELEHAISLALEEAETRGHERGYGDCLKVEAVKNLVQPDEETRVRLGELRVDKMVTLPREELYKTIAFWYETSRMWREKAEKIAKNSEQKE